MACSPQANYRIFKYQYYLFIDGLPDDYSVVNYTILISSYYVHTLRAFGRNMKSVSLSKNFKSSGKTAWYNRHNNNNIEEAVFCKYQQCNTDTNTREYCIQHLPIT
jgi:hypothetical protein